MYVLFMRAFEVKYVPNNELKSILKENFYFYRPVVPGCTGCAVAHPDFGRSVNPIPTRGTDYAHLITTGTPGFSDLPTALFYALVLKSLNLYITERKVSM